MAIEFKYIPVKYNFSSRKGQKIQYIVIHDTGNTSAGADAMAHQRYFNGGNRNASAHYFVDDKRIVQIIGDSMSAWHCGDNQGYGRSLNGVKNATSIGIELCINKDGDYNAAFYHTVELTKNLMEKFSVPASRVCTHYDVSRKQCPGTMKPGNWAKWREFQALIQEPIKIKFDLTRDSTGVEVEELKKREEIVKEDSSKKYVYEEAPAEMRDVEKGFELYKEASQNQEPSEWAKESWEKAKAQGITDGTFPQRYATRQEVVALIERAMEVK